MAIRAIRMRRRPDEGCMLYHTRTSELCKRLFVGSDVDMLHTRKFKSVFKSSRKEIWLALDNGDQPLKRLLVSNCASSGPSRETL